MLDTTIQVKTDRFDGPLGLLLLLVKKEEMDIRELDLTMITRQYLDFLSQMKELNFDVAGDYLYLAATLIHLKSNTCLDEEDVAKLQEGLNISGDLRIATHADLVWRLEELERFQRLGESLWSLPKKGHEVFLKPKVDRKTIINSILTPMDLEHIVLAMVDILRRDKRKYTVIKRDRLSIKEKLVFLKSFLEVGKKTHLEEVLENDGEQSNDNIVITFISLLELARLNKIQIFQNEPKGNIYVEVINSLDDFDINAADGFEEEGVDESPELESKEEQEELFTEVALPAIPSEDSEDKMIH